MQDIRLRLEQQHLPVTNTLTTVANTTASNSPVPTTSIALKTTKANLQNRCPLQLLPPISFSELSIEQRIYPQSQVHYHPQKHVELLSHRQQQHQHHQKQQFQPSSQYQKHQLQHLQLQHAANDQLQLPYSPSSEEDNSPTEMNNCRRLVDKPPLVKRLTMGMGLLRATEDSRPLVHPTNSSSQTICDGYVNEAICEPDKLISSKFGDSCRQSLTALEATQLLHEQHNEFGGYQKKKYLRETCSANSSPKLFAPSVPLRLDGLSLAEQQELKGAAWFQAGIPREISLEVLTRQSPGAFLVRQSSTKPGCFALSLRVPPPAPKVAHYLIMRTTRGYKIKGFTKEFSSLRALITHHSVMPELLPVPLTLPRPPPHKDSSVAGGNGSHRLDIDADIETYGSLNDFRKMMSDMNV